MTEEIREASRVGWSGITAPEASRDPTELGWQHGESRGKVRVLEQVPDFSPCCSSVRVRAAVVAGAGPFRGCFGIEPMFLLQKFRFIPINL